MFQVVLPNLKKDKVSLDQLEPKQAEKLLEATLEALITPESKALSLDITLAKRKNLADNQRPLITQVLDEFVISFQVFVEIG